MDDADAFKIFENLHKHSDSIAIALPVEKVNKPNVVVIVLESFLNQLINLKYKGKEVVPNLNRLSKEGVYFSNLYASGDRSDKGLVALFSGYPALPKSSLVQYPEKFSKVPSIFRDVKKAGYSTSFYYGGNLDFANLSAYFLASEVGQTVTGSSVGTNLPHGKWGVHDEAMFNEFYIGVSKMKSPFFASFFTLSNHDPYDIPGVYQFGKSNADEEYMSTAWYTDYHLGLFLGKLKSSDTWKNTLVVLVADHGVLRLNLEVFCDPAKYRIPMIWTGGLVKSPMQVGNVVSQTDIPLMILNQIGVKPIQNYTYSNLPFFKHSSEFANFYYNNGMGIAIPGCTTVFDNVTLDYYAQYCQNDSIGNIAKAYLQVLSKDFTGKP
jgi:phosphoglycerol transferase MdoB-like AlkP superfamily enzyme